MSAAVDMDHIAGMGYVKNGEVGRMRILTSIDALMSSTEMGLMEMLCIERLLRRRPDRCAQCSQLPAP